MAQPSQRKRSGAHAVLTEPSALRHDGSTHSRGGFANDPDGLPLFILSADQRDELSLMASRMGWKPVAARSRDRAESRYLGSLARTALIDLRGVPSSEA